MSGRCKTVWTITFKGLIKQRKVILIRECVEIEILISGNIHLNLCQNSWKSLDALWGDDMTMNRIKKVVGIAAIKNKGSTDVYKAAENDNGEHSDSIEKLPMYIYNF